MGARAIGFLVRGFEDKGYAAALRDVNKTLRSRQSHFSTLDDTGTCNQDERTIPADTYVTYLDYQDSPFKNGMMPNLTDLVFFNVRKNATIIKKAVIPLPSCFSTVIHVF
jgi:hypothetical protein